jgi:hypothetical protein
MRRRKVGMDYIRNYYRVPVKRGMTVRVRADKRQGKILSVYGSHLAVRMDGEKIRRYFHPGDLDYLTNDGVHDDISIWVEGTTSK